MLKRSIVLFSFGVAAVLFGVSHTEAQPGKGPKGGTDTKKLEKDVAQLLDAVKAIAADLARLKADSDKKSVEGKKGFGPGGPGGFAKGPEKLDPATVKEKYEFYKKLYDALPAEKGKSTSNGFEGKFGGWRGGFGGGFGRGGIEFKKGPETKAPSGNIEARLDHLIHELQELRGELKKSKGGEDKKGFEGKKGFEFKKKFGGDDE